jgi:hypothetical protein
MLEALVGMGFPQPEATEALIRTDNRAVQVPHFSLHAPPFLPIFPELLFVTGCTRLPRLQTSRRRRRRPGRRRSPRPFRSGCPSDPAARCCAHRGRWQVRPYF